MRRINSPRLKTHDCPTLSCVSKKETHRLYIFSFLFFLMKGETVTDLSRGGANPVRLRSKKRCNIDYRLWYIYIVRATIDESSTREWRVGRVQKVIFGVGIGKKREEQFLVSYESEFSSFPSSSSSLSSRTRLNFANFFRSAILTCSNRAENRRE